MYKYMRAGGSVDYALHNAMYVFLYSMSVNSFNLDQDFV